VHCEDPELIELLATPQKEKQGPEAWLASREGITEAKGLQTLIDFMSYTNSPALAVHLSGKEAAALVRKAAQEKGRPRLYVETCPHYLMLTHENSQDTFGKVNPPLRRQEDCDALWELITDGHVDVIGSDHIARPRDKKEGGTWKALAGFPGSYAILPILFAEGHLKRKYPLEKVAALTSGNAARLFGLYPHKGRIAPGADADLAILDPDLEMDFSSAAVASKPGYSLYEHLRLRGRPVMTLVRGTVVMENGTITGPVGHGRYLRRNDAPGLP
jgi:dihydropyrimidinase